MNLRERIQALRSRRASKKPDIHPHAALKTSSPNGTPSKQSRLHNVAARQQWHQQQLQNAAKKARQNVIDTGVYDVITRAPPPEKKEEPLVKEEPPDDPQNEDTHDDNESNSPELDEEQMERDEEERALEHANRRLLFDDNSKQSVDKAQQQLNSTDDGDEPQHSSQTHSVKTSERAEQTDDPLADKPSSTLKSCQSPEQDCPPAATDENNVQSNQPSSDSLKQHQGAPVVDKQQCDVGEQLSKPQTRPSPVQDTSPHTPDQPARKAMKKKNKFCWFDNAPQNPLGMVDDEADEDNADDVANLANEGDDEFGAHPNESDDDGIDHDEVSPSATDKNKLAQFHRRWQLDKEKNELANAAAGGVVDDIDEAVDLTDLLQKEGQEVKDNESEHNGSTSAAGNVSNEADEAKRQSENYMEQMFQRDDSRSRIMDDIDDDPDDDQKREKARALWKARHKAKVIRQQQDNDSLSRFDLFDNQSISRSADIRQKLEKACRRSSSQPQTNGNKKRKNPWSIENSLSDWEKQRKSMQNVAVKKRRGVPVSNWSFAVHGNQEKTSKKSVRPSNPNPSLGASFVHSRSRSRHVPVKTAHKAAHKTTSLPPRQVSHGNSHGPTSFRGLLTLLGKSAQTTE